MIKLLIADDHDLFRSGVKALLSRNENLEVVGEANNGTQLLELAAKLYPDVILADISMPEMNGLDAIKELKKIDPGVKVILLTMHEDGEYIVKGVKNGASGYLLKNADEEELVMAIKTVAKGGRYFNSKISELMMEKLSSGEPDPDDYKNLTPREKEILALVAEGLSTKLIADKLYISARTVETHRVNMMKKMEVSNTAELVKKAMALNILS